MAAFVVVVVEVVVDTEVDTEAFWKLREVGEGIVGEEIEGGVVERYDFPGHVVGECVVVGCGFEREAVGTTKKSLVVVEL
eukprot:m.91880 g.91880  ORF g.91880 m.91880 type:complete len:80 (+) comp8880_c4_seq2:1929-2168(+)